MRRFGQCKLEYHRRIGFLGKLMKHQTIEGPLLPVWSFQIAISKLCLWLLLFLLYIATHRCKVLQRSSAPRPMHRGLLSRCCVPPSSPTPVLDNIEPTCLHRPLPNHYPKGDIIWSSQALRATSIGHTFLSSTSGQISGVSCTKASHNNSGHILRLGPHTHRPHLLVCCTTAIHRHRGHILGLGAQTHWAGTSPRVCRGVRLLDWASKSTLLALDQRRFETLIWLSIFLMSPVASEIDRWPCVHRIVFGSRANPDGSINSARFRTCRFFLHLDISSSLGRSFNFFGKSRK
ncbi:hypothetical protein MUK42_35021 [Musa troglodytarum]|uniref:Uncharacterized protein n=1 Tax=Musa troglodytarum TaxID=320322 RepID=A0A9E7EDY9_9LILI|nr:hypothetical protein MUK42_35021 [Musa troglodytarum]